MAHRAKIPHLGDPALDQPDDEMEQLMQDETMENHPEGLEDSPDVRAIEEFLVGTGRLVRREDVAQKAAEAARGPIEEAYHRGYREGYTVGFQDGQANPQVAEGQELPQPVAVEASTDPLSTWWLELAQSEVGPLLAKAEQYGGQGRAVDLIDIGRTMAAVAGRGTLTDAEASELGVFFYVTGKMGRWHAAVRDSRPVSDDTLHDIGIYVRMVQRIRQVGGWPV